MKRHPRHPEAEPETPDIPPTPQADGSSAPDHDAVEEAVGETIEPRRPGSDVDLEREPQTSKDRSPEPPDTERPVR